MNYQITYDDRLDGLRVRFLWFFASLFYAYQSLLRVSPGVMSDELMHAFTIDATRLGLFTSAYYYAYVGMQLPLGLLIDKFGAERLIAFAALLLGGASAMFAFAPNVMIASIARFCMGGCSACGWIGCVVLATRWFPVQQKSLIIALSMGIGTIGAMLGGLPLEILISYVGWEKSLAFLALVGVLIGSVIYFIICSIPPQHHPPIAKESQFSGSLLKTLAFVSANPQCWLVSSYAMLMWLPIAVVGDQWGVSFLERSYNLKEGIAATLIAYLFIGVSVGAPVFAMFASKFSSYRLPMMIGASLCFVLYSTLIFAPNLPLTLLYIIFFLAGVGFTSQLLCFSLLADITSASSSGVTMAFTNMIVMTSGIIGLPSVGWILDWSASPVGTVGMEVYTAADFRIAFIFIPICMVLACLLLLRIRETYPS